VAKKKKSEQAPAPSFEEALSQLEAIVQHLEEGNVGLAESLNLYEQGATLLKQGHQLLAEAERRIEQVSGSDADGNPVLEPFSRSSQGAKKRPSGRKVSTKAAKDSGEKTARDEEAASESALF